MEPHAIEPAREKTPENTHTAGDFESHTMRIIKQEVIDPKQGSRQNEGCFNGGEHTFLEAEAGNYQTISVKLPAGGFVTFAFVPSSDKENFECVDIHTTVGGQIPRPDGAGGTLYPQKLIGFTTGTNTFDTRKIPQITTLATLLLAPGHYAK